MIESGDKQLNCRFVTDSNKSRKLHSDLRFKGFKICDENFVLEFLRKSESDLRRHWIIGFSILELSKFIMQSMYYKVLKPAFGDNISILMSDTDSYSILIKGKTADEAKKILTPVMDFSNLDKNDPLFDSARKNIVGYMKCETGSDEIIKFCALKAKTYSFITKKNILENKAKGVKRAAKNTLKFNDYAKCILSPSEVRVTQYSISAKNHVNRLSKSNKMAFTSFDDKRYALCSIHNTPYNSITIQYQLENNGKCYFCENSDKLY